MACNILFSYNKAMPRNHTTRKRGGHPMNAIKKKRQTELKLVQDVLKELLKNPPNREAIHTILQNPEFNINRTFTAGGIESTLLLELLTIANRYSDRRQIYLAILDDFLKVPTLDVMQDITNDRGYVSDTDIILTVIQYKDIESLLKLIPKIPSNAPNLDLYLYYCLFDIIRDRKNEIKYLPVLHAFLQHGANPEKKHPKARIDKTPLELAREFNLECTIQLFETGDIPFRNIPKGNNAINAIMHEPIEEGNMMANFNGEYGWKRYYKKSTYNELPKPKKNPTTRVPITSVSYYKAHLVGGKRTRRKKINVGEHIPVGL